MTERRLTQLIALFVLLVAVSVYLITLTPTVPFWDSGEFIAVSWILGIPHPPGTPFYVLLGRIATMVPWASIAQRVNALSAVSSALAVMFTYLVGLKFLRLVQGKERTTSDRWIAHLGAVTGALLLAFSDSFWENSIEAEVYATMSFAQIFVLWLGLRWWEEHEVKPAVGPLLLATYVMWLCVGLHLGVAIMSLPLLALVFLVDRKVATLFLMPFLTSLLVTMGLERLAGGVLALGTFTFIVYSMQKKLNGWVVAGCAAAALYGMGIAFGDSDFGPASAIVASLAVLVPMALLAWRHREGRILALALLLMVVGYSTHLYLPIRAAQHPGVNEGDPSNWENLRDLLERKQYGTMNMFVRRGTLENQLNKEFWRYFNRQWPVVPSQTPKGPVFPTDQPMRSAIPLLLGVAGMVWHFRKEKTSFLTQFIFVGVTTAGMIVFLNFSDHEVRERDYFFQSGFHAYALWIGMGVSWLVSWVRDSFEAGTPRTLATAATGLLLALQPVGLLWNLWFTHDRRGNTIARDYAYNMLAPLAPNSFVFTNGDNDTFPLWYIQQVENFRKDVRVVNLSLLNTDWYIRQLRDEEPKVPIALDDATIKMLARGFVQDESGRVIYTNQYMVQHIIQQDRTADGKGWHKQPYFAVTVPEHMGLDPYFTLEALVYRVNRDSLQGDVDVEATRNALYKTFRYGGLFKPDGSWDPSVYKDENSATLSRNYAAAHLQLAFKYRRAGDLDRGIAELERVARMFPDYVEVQLPLGGFYMDRGDTAKAMELYAKLAADNPRDPEARYYHGVSMLYRGKIAEGVQELEAAIQNDPNYNLPYYAAYTALWSAGQHERALSYLERWLALHPDDDQAAALLDQQRRSLSGGLSPSSPMPPPRLPGLR